MAAQIVHSSVLPIMSTKEVDVTFLRATVDEFGRPCRISVDLGQYHLVRRRLQHKGQWSCDYHVTSPTNMGCGHVTIM